MIITIMFICIAHNNQEHSISALDKVLPIQLDFFKAFMKLLV